MNVVIVYKWERDPEEIFVNDDGSTKLRRDRLVPNDDDAEAIANARELAQATGGELVAATIGSGDVPWAMARGAARAVTADALMPSIDNAQTAEALEQVVRAAGEADVVVMGDARNFSGVAPVLAAKLGVPFVGEVQDFEIDPADSQKLIAHRKAGKQIETLSIQTPALIAVAAVDSEKNVPSIKQMLAAKKAPVEKIEAAASGETAMKAVAHRCPELHRARIFEGSAAEAAGQLVATLRADGVL